jgi:hypothetical protein
VKDFLALVGRNVLVINDVEGVGTRYLLTSWCVARSNALAELAKLVGIGSIPRGFVMGVSTKLAMFKELASCWIQDGQGRGAIDFHMSFTAVCKAICLLVRH